MKKVLATILALVMALSVTTAAWAGTTENCAGGESCAHQAAIGNTHYDTLKAAVAAVADGGEVTLLRDVPNGVGIGTFANPSEGQIKSKSFTINFDGKTYTLKSEPVGSGNTETQGFHLEWAGASNAIPSVVFKNGKIDVAKDRNANMMMAIQNYCNLTLDNMIVDGTNLAHGWGSNGNTYTYVTSNNCGNTTIKDSVILAKDGSVAFDIDGDRGSYSAASVRVSGDSVIDGRFEVSDQNNKGNTLAVSGGAFTEDMTTEENEKYIAEDAAVAVAGTMSVIGADNIVAVAQEGIDVDVKAGTVNFTDVPVGVKVTNNGGTVSVNGTAVAVGKTHTVPQPPRYYYNSTTTTTDTKKDTTKGSPKTFDAGVGIYAVSAILSVTGMAYVGKKKF